MTRPESVSRQSGVSRSLCALFITAVVGLVFGQVLRFDFVAWDDNLLVYENPLYNPLIAEKIGLVWRAPYLELYTPLTYSAWGILSLWARQVTPGGSETHLAPGVFHATNLLLHALCALLVFGILRRVLNHRDSDNLPDESRLHLAAAAGALLFALHPLQVEAVAWVSELKGMLSSFFVLLAIWQFLNALQNDTKKRSNMAIALCAFALALLSKPSAVTAPLIALILGKIGSELSWREVALRLKPWWILALVWIFVARWAQPAAGINTPFWWRPFVAGDALAYYSAKLLFPLQLAPHYGRTPDRVMAQPWAYIMWLVPCVFATAFWRLRRPQLAAAGWLLLIPLLPVLGFVPFRFQGYSTVADRYAFLSLLGPALLLSWWLARSAKPKYAVAGTLLVVLAALSFRQTATWANSRALFDHTLKVNPNSWMALNNLGNLMESEGKNESAKELYKRALEANPMNKESHNNLAILLANSGDITNAENELRESLKIDQNYATAWLNLGNVLAAQGRFQEAVSAYTEAKNRMPFSGDVRANLGLALAKLGHPDEAVAQYNESLKMRPNDSETYYNLGLANIYRKDYNAALVAFSRAALLTPDYWEARHAIGLTFLAQGKRGKAQKVWQEILRLNPSFEPARQSLQMLKKMPQ